MMYQLTWQHSMTGGWTPIRQIVGDINSVAGAYNALVDLARHTQNPLNAEVRSLIPTGKEHGALIYKWGVSFVTEDRDPDRDPLEGYSRNRSR